MDRTETDLERLDKQTLWHPFTQMKEWMESPQLVIERGRGVYLYDTRGRKYLDGVSSLWANIHGHSHPHIVRAIRRQLDRLDHSTLLGLTNVPAVQLAGKLVELTPPNLTRVFFSDDGATAVEIALKMSFQYWRNRGRRWNSLRSGPTSTATPTPTSCGPSDANWIAWTTAPCSG
ncbi:MAG: aminotransferase class III-fold pyridoxal phosphate-dependent enzyme [Acidobacteria bacterium]|nr:aminotransferase class III-fold pyridoxal phosphate-dependent enzyme [Acidobacteriota bacterium]